MQPVGVGLVRKLHFDLDRYSQASPMQNQQPPTQAMHALSDDTTGIANDLPRVNRKIIPHPPSWPYGQSDLKCALLEHLDDVIFSAIAGDADSLQKARTMWPRVIVDHGWELVEESQEQYLRCAIDAMVQIESQEMESLDRVTALTEVIELLTAS